MSSAYVTADNTMVQLDGSAGPPVVITAEDVQDPEKLARLLEQALRENAELRRRWTPRQMFVRDLVVTTLGSYRLEHHFGGRVNYHVVRWVPDSTGSPDLFEVIESQTSNDVLTLFSSADGTATICIEEAG